MTADKKYRETTIAVRTGVDTDTQHGAIMPSLCLSTNFTFENIGKPRKYDYTRSGNPTRDLLGRSIADLEGGHDAVIVATGMAAVDLPLYLLEPDDLLIICPDCYGGTYRLLTARAKKKHFRLKFIDQTDLEALKAACAEDPPRMIYIETPSNPLLRLTDIRAVTDIAKEHGALTVADNTFLSPVLQKPIEYGVDIVVHSTTKYLNGHSDLVGGAVIAKDPQIQEQLFWWANCLGITGSPFDSYLTMRGMRTLNLRVEQAQKNAERIVSFLNEHPAVEKVYYPGLPDHPGHDIAKAQQKGFGAMLSFELKDGNEESVRKFLRPLELFSLAQSLGGVESLVAHPASMTHLAMGPEGRAAAGISDTLLRLSIGVEDVEDLIEDLESGLIAL